MHFPKKDVIKGIKGPCKNKLQTQPRALSPSLSHSPTPFILRVLLDPVGAGPQQPVNPLPVTSGKSIDPQANGASLCTFVLESQVLTCPFLHSSFNFLFVFQSFIHSVNIY